MADEILPTGDFAAAFDAGIAAASPHLVPPENRAYTIVPAGAQIEDLEPYQDAPSRIRATPAFHDVASLLAYHERFGDACSLIYADPMTRTIVDVLDASLTADDPSWATHRATLTFSISPQWQAWKALHRKSIDQVTFAEFLEDHLDDIQTPDAADVLETAKHLDARRAVSFRSAVNLATGAVQFLYDDALEGTGGRGQVIVPDRLGLLLPVFVGGGTAPISARLRYRLNADKLSFTIVIDRAEEIERVAFLAEVAAIGNAVESTVLLGKP